MTIPIGKDTEIAIVSSSEVMFYPLFIWQCECRLVVVAVVVVVVVVVLRYVLTPL